MAAKASEEAMWQAEQCLAAGIATRVGSIISIFFDFLGKQQDSFPAIQGVEASWRELSGLEEESALRHSVLPKIVSLQHRAIESRLPSGVAVNYALESARLLVAEWLDGSPRYFKVAGSALGVALEFDRFGIDVPDGHESWAAFELVGEAALANQIFQEPRLLDKKELFGIRMAAGAGAMPYSDAFAAWVRS